MVEFYDYEGLGYVVDPESDTKEVFIPSPPTKTTVKINPRAAVIYITGGAVKEGYAKLDALKAYAEENKTVFICPSSDEPEEVGKTYEYVMSKFKLLNIKRDELSVLGAPGCVDAAQAVVDHLVDECDADVDDAEEFDV